MYTLSFLGLLPASPCVSAGIPVGGERAEHVLTSQFIVILAGGPSSGRRCSKPRRVEGAWKRERTVSTWLGSVCGGACHAGKESWISPLRLSREVEPSQEMMQRHSKSGRARAWASPGSSAVGWGGVACTTPPSTGAPEFRASLRQPSSLKWQIIIFALFCLWDCLCVSNEL